MPERSPIYSPLRAVAEGAVCKSEGKSFRTCYDRSFTNFNEPALAVITAAVKRRNFDTVSLPGEARASKKIR